MFRCRACILNAETTAFLARFPLLQDLENTIGSWELYGHEEKARYPSIQGEFFQRAAAGLTRREYLLAFVAGCECSGLVHVLCQHALTERHFNQPEGFNMSS